MTAATDRSRPRPAAGPRGGARQVGAAVRGEPRARDRGGLRRLVRAGDPPPPPPGGWSACCAPTGSTAVGLDILASPYTDVVGSIADRALVRDAMAGVDAVLHAATLHKPHVGSHTPPGLRRHQRHRHAQPARGGGRGRRRRFVFTSTTSAFGRALTPPPGAPAAWITEDVAPVPRNIYGVTKTAAEDLCELVHRDHGLPCLILRTSRFFPEADDRDESAPPTTTPTSRSTSCSTAASTSRTSSAPTGSRSSARPRSASAATSSAPRRRSPATTSPSCAPTRPRSSAAASPTTRRSTRGRGWRMFPSIERVYVNERARTTSAGRTPPARAPARAPRRGGAGSGRGRAGGGGAKRDHADGAGMGGGRGGGGGEGGGEGAGASTRGRAERAEATGCAAPPRPPPPGGGGARPTPARSTPGARSTRSRRSRARSSSARWSRRSRSGTRPCSPAASSPPTTSPAGASSSGSAPAGTRASTARSASRSTRRATGSAAWPSRSRSSSRSWADEPFDFEGRFYRLEERRAAEAGQTRPNLIVGGSAQPRGAALAARWADEYNTVNPSAEEARERKQRIDAACAEAGRDPIPFSAMIPLEGAPDALIERLRGLAEAGVERVMLQHLAHEDLATVELVGREVIGAV